MKRFLASSLLAAISALPSAAAPPPPSIVSISVCSSTGAGGQGSCPAGSFDTHQIVLGPNGGVINSYDAKATADEHSTVFPPGALGTNTDYLFFVGSGTNLSPDIGTSVLSGGTGPASSGQWIFNPATSDGYGVYTGGFGPVFRPPSSEQNCPVVSNATLQDPTFDLNYAAPGTVIKDPTAPAGSLLMIYEGTNTCVGSSGGPRAGAGVAYISTSIATSLDYGKTWPTYRGTSTFSFVQMPFGNQTSGPNAPSGALGANVCEGNNCGVTPSAAYGRYPVLTPPLSIPAAIAAAQTFNGDTGDAEPSAFLDDASGIYPPYVYVVHDYTPVGGQGTDIAVARAQLNGGAAPLSFNSWNGQAFNSPGIGGAEAYILPSGPFQNCESSGQLRGGGSIQYVETTRQYLLLFTCRSTSDPALGIGGGPAGVAWFYATSPDPSNPALWSTPQEITGSFSTIDSSGGCSSYKGWYPTMMSLGAVPGHITTSGYVFYLWGCETGAGTTTAPPRQYSSRMFTITLSQPCTYSFGSAGQAVSSAGGSITLNITTAANCPWSVGQLPSWITVAGASAGVGPGTVTLNVAPNSGADLFASITIGGTSFLVEQEAPALSGLNFSGSMPHLAAEGGWLTTFTLVNKGPSSAIARMTLLADSGNPLTVPVNLPQQPQLAGSILASSLDQTIAPDATFVMQAAGPANVAYVTGSAQLAATLPPAAGVDGFAIFHFTPSNQEAVVPMETRNASSYLLAFDNTNNVLTGVALENVSGAAASIPLVIRDDTGRVLLTPVIALPPYGHMSCVLSQAPCYPATANIRGTVEFDTPVGGQISVLGIRYTPPGTLTTIPALANVGTGGGTIAHLAVNDTWQTTFVLVNTGTSAANVTLKFFDDNGNALALPLTFPQGTIAPQTASSLTETIAPNASLWVASVGANPQAATFEEGSAQLTTTGNVGGFVIFRYNANGQEAVVPLESRNAGSYFLAFDNTNGTATGVAINNASGQAINVPVTLRDGTGAVLTIGSIPLPANGHTSFGLVQQFPQTAGVLGTAEFDAPAAATISVLGIRSPPALTFTTLPALAK